MYLFTSMQFIMGIYRGLGTGGQRSLDPLEMRFYREKFSKLGKFHFSYYYGPLLLGMGRVGKCSSHEPTGSLTVKPGQVE